MKTYLFDLDGTLCTHVEDDYMEAKPFKDRIKIVNKLYDAGNRIIIDTGRGSKTGLNWTDCTLRQLRRWGLKHHVLRVGMKPYYDYLIDDRALDLNEFFKKTN